ncbi:MAG TPA: hypothetical protein VKF15_02750 [Nitrososphaerales archaeon]|nr:hypothetical protein [Nitrososphaerales archaeon]
MEGDMERDARRLERLAMLLTGLNAALLVSVLLLLVIDFAP